MNLADGFLVAMAVVDVIAVGAMGFIAMQYLGSAKRGQAQIAPALKEAKSVAERGKTLANHAKEKGGATFAHVKDVAAKVKQRADTTARLAKELKPTAEGAGEAIKDGLQEGKKDLAHHVETAQDWATRLNRIRIAAGAAGAAARAAEQEAPLNGHGRPS
jgi:hypothetical protein